MLTFALARPGAAATTDSFVNWENPPLHAVDISPDGSLLAVCNLPDGRVELFDIQSGAPAHEASIPVGVDPVTVRFRTADELWVVNHISDSISVVDIPTRRVRATIATLDEPFDVVFAGSPVRAWVSCSQVNTVQIFNVDTLAEIAPAIEIDAEDPRSMAVSPDGSKVYVAVFESGNASTLIAGGGEVLNVISFPPNAVSDPAGPYGGVNPPPNHGAGFEPPQNSSTWIDSHTGSFEPPPPVGLIVKKNPQGQWMDDNGGDWTGIVTGPNIPGRPYNQSGRVPGWDMPDRDIAVIDTETMGVTYATGLMNICMSLSVNPATGQIALVGTDGTNEVRFEPNVNGRFLRVLAAFVDPASLAKTIVDLNPHLGDYTQNRIDQSERDKSLGDPRGIVWMPDGSKGYVSGMGSNNVIVIDGAGNRIGAVPIETGEGPTGMAIDAARGRLYVLNRFAASITVVNTATDTAMGNFPFFDPTPEVIRVGRKHLYDTHKNSGLGYVACGSCHIDSRMDRLAWDLGDPEGTLKAVRDLSQGGQHNLGMNVPGLNGNSGTNPNYKDFHPMKGPMTTQTLQDIIGHEPHHWRGDRDGLEEFNAAFMVLQADDENLTPEEMQEFEDFLATVTIPPNPIRSVRNTIPPSVNLTGHYASGRFAAQPFGLQAGAQLPDGDPNRGRMLYGVGNGGPLIDRGALDCVSCHTLPTGMGSDTRLSGVNFIDAPVGPLGEHHIALISLDGSTNRAIKTPQLRNMLDKLGTDFTHPSSRAGFGFLHDGSVDSLARFVGEEAFFVQNDQDVADLVAFVLCLPGSNLPRGFGFLTNPNLEPYGPTGKDTHAGVGKQLTVSAPPSAASLVLYNDMLVVANEAPPLVNMPGPRADLVVKGRVNGEDRGWYYDRATSVFLADRDGETIAPAALLALAAPGSELTYTIVPRGTGRRIGIDRDEDGFGDRTEMDFGSDPANIAQTPSNQSKSWRRYK